MFDGKRSIGTGGRRAGSGACGGRAASFCSFVAGKPATRRRSAYRLARDGICDSGLALVRTALWIGSGTASACPRPRAEIEDGRKNARGWFAETAQRVRNVRDCAGGSVARRGRDVRRGDYSAFVARPGIQADERAGGARGDFSRGTG